MVRILKTWLWQQGIPAFLILLFTYTAGSKLAHLSFFRAQLSVFPYVSPVAAWLAPAVPFSEGLAVVLLFLQRTRTAGLRLSFWLLLLFTLYIGVMVLTQSDLPCSCGGILQSLSWPEHLLFNGVVLALTGVALRGIREDL